MAADALTREEGGLDDHRAVAVEGAMVVTARVLRLHPADDVEDIMEDASRALGAFISVATLDAQARARRRVRF
jgi:hypothetical protein